MEATLSPRIDDVAEIAKDRLRNSPYASLRTLSCDLEGGGLVLRGHLPSFHHKQLAQETVRRLAGVRQIINATEVVD
jgi:osmotically-inducible protein OsmY